MLQEVVVGDISKNISTLNIMDFDHGFNTCHMTIQDM